MRPRTLGSKVGISLLSLIGCLLVIEISLRIAGYNPVFGEHVGRKGILRYTPDADYLYDLHPGRMREVQGQEMAINAAGFRDREYELAKPAGTYRIVALGDSITFGTRLALDEIWTEQLEARLAAVGHDAEVLNFGVDGFDTEDEVAFLVDKALPYEPDMVVVAYCYNDVATITPHLAYVERIQRMSGPLLHSRCFQWCMIQFERNTRRSRIDALLEEDELSGERSSIEGDRELLAMMRELTGALAPWDGPIDEGDPPMRARTEREIRWYTSRPRLEKLRWSLERLRELSLEHDFEVCVVLLPILDEGPEEAFRDLWSHAYRMVEHEVDRLGFHRLSTVEAFRAAGIVELRVVPKDRVHPGAEGHRIIAETIESFLLTRPPLGEGESER